MMARRSLWRENAQKAGLSQQVELLFMGLAGMGFSAHKQFKAILKVPISTPLGSVNVFRSIRGIKDIIEKKNTLFTSSKSYLDSSCLHS